MRINSISADKYSYKTKPSFKAIRITDEKMRSLIPRYDRRILKRYNTRKETRFIMQFFTEEAEREIPNILGNCYKKIPSIVIRNSIRNRAKEILKNKPKIDFEPIIVQYYNIQKWWDDFEDARKNGIYVEPVLRFGEQWGPYEVNYNSCDFPIPFTISKNDNIDDNYDYWRICNVEDVPHNEDLFSEIYERFRYLTDPDYFMNSSEVNIGYANQDLVRELIDKNTEFQKILQKVKANALEEKDITNISEVPPISKLNTKIFV